MCKGKILWQFETIKVYKDLYGNKSHSSMTGWQELFFRHKSFDFWRVLQPLLLKCTAENLQVT